MRLRASPQTWQPVSRRRSASGPCALCDRAALRETSRTGSIPQQRLHMAQPAHARDGLRRNGHVSLDVRECRSRRTPCRHRPTGSSSRCAGLPSRSNSRDLKASGTSTSSPLRRTRPPAASPGDAGASGAGTRTSAGFEREHELARVRQTLFEHRGNAIGRHHVETDSGRDDDSLDASHEGARDGRARRHRFRR